jgi:hypothetical protein
MMVSKINFADITALAMQDPSRATMRPVIEKELLHYDMLYCLDAAGLLDQLTFQGGTSLRLCYGAPRFSEDLDFAGGKNFDKAQLYAMKDCLENYIGERYGLEVHVKEPTNQPDEPQDGRLHVEKWQLSVITAPAKKDIPKQKIKIEVANIDAYSRQPRALQTNYNFLPDGYADTLVLTETLEEIMADKLVSLANSTRHIRHRDIWDLRWLKQQSVNLRADWVKNKINDYKITDYPEKLDSLLLRLADIIHGDSFRNEMQRFIPQDVQERTLKKPKFLMFMTTEITTLFEQVKAEQLKTNLSA